LRPPPSPSPLLPYTTLFRSCQTACSLKLKPTRDVNDLLCVVVDILLQLPVQRDPVFARKDAAHRVDVFGDALGQHLRRFLIAARSEEHTSELQSRSDLVCRL